MDRITTDVIAKITASTGNAQRSNAWTRLCPKNASPVWMTTMSTSASSGPMWNSVDSANAPLTLLVANHPTPAVIDISRAGTTLPLNPNGSRPSTICGTPCSGPRADRTSCANAPSPVPMTMPATACQNVMP